MLSTPHGTLGTKAKKEEVKQEESFNSTRYIRNYELYFILHQIIFLSTPHGTLGTVLRNLDEYARFYFQLHTVH